MFLETQCVSITGRPFTGTANTALLNLARTQYKSNVFGTYKQLQEAGWQVRKGEKGTSIWHPREGKAKTKDGAVKTDENGEPLKRKFYGGITVFNLEQCDPIETKPEEEKEEVAQ